MKIERVEAYAVHIDHHYKVGGKAHRPNRLGETDYYFEPNWSQVYATQLMSCLVKVTADDGSVGWGEAQSPIAPEVVVKIVEQLVGPAALGQDPRATDEVYDRLYGMMNVRGHHEGFMVDAIAGLDTALWDLKGRSLGVPVRTLVGGSERGPIPAYVSGLRRPSREENLAQARELVREGYGGIKLFLGGEVDEVVSMMRDLRETVGPECRLMTDLLWRHDLHGARRIARGLAEVGVDFLEAPIRPEHLEQHVELSAASPVPIAVGEGMRTRHSFLPWLQKGAAHVFQPDVGRTGISEALQIAALVRAHGRRLTWHVGTCTPVAMAATWQLNSLADPGMLQEHQLDLFSAVNHLVKEPLTGGDGAVILPGGPGLGVEIDEEALARHVTSSCDVRG